MKMKKSTVTTEVAPKVGRPPKNVAFPKKGEFTVLAMFNRLKRYPKAKISKVALTKKIRGMIAVGLAEEVGKQQGPSGRGRPEYRFKLTEKGVKTLVNA